MKRNMIVVTNDLIFAIIISSSNCHTNCQTNKYYFFSKMTNTYLYVFMPMPMLLDTILTAIM